MRLGHPAPAPHLGGPSGDPCHRRNPGVGNGGALLTYGGRDAEHEREDDVVPDGEGVIRDGHAAAACCTCAVVSETVSKPQAACSSEWLIRFFLLLSTLGSGKCRLKLGPAAGTDVVFVQMHVALQGDVPSSPQALLTMPHESDVHLKRKITGLKPTTLTVVGPIRLKQQRKKFVSKSTIVF